AFNEPGSSLGSRTRVKTLAQKTVRDNARFFDDPAAVPRRAITMCIGYIMDERRILHHASVSLNADAVRVTLVGPITAMVPATMVQMHRHAHVLVDADAAGALAYRHHDGLVEPKEQARKAGTNRG
ncbi:MAG: glucosamine-6-phosphate deaminase, partial [Rhodothermales bacterium]|nr:glucosamine-6-phosphate deaminase [Rhodothermales bacterium]